MSKVPKKAPRKTAVRRAATAIPSDADLNAVLRLIDDARTRALTAVNTALIDLYWALGEYISRRIEAEAWGTGTVKALAEHIAMRRPNARGFAIIRMVGLGRPAPKSPAMEFLIPDHEPCRILSFQ
jgi:hypothetical protein